MRFRHIIKCHIYIANKLVKRRLLVDLGKVNER